MIDQYLNQIICGDALEVLKGMPDDCIHCCVTDPPYELGFMGKKWDKTGAAYSVDLWREVCRVLKPGAHLLAFGGSRTHHRIWCAIEDAGFEIMWVYGSGFPKSLDVSKAIDKAAGANREIVGQGKPVKRIIPGADQDKTGSWIKDNGREYTPITSIPATDAAREWSGWGTALKPAYEPIVVARKPLNGTVVKNVMRHGTGAINIDGCRIETDESTVRPSCSQMFSRDGIRSDNGRSAENRSATGSDLGRWPANIILDEEAGAVLDKQSGLLTSGNNPSKRSADKHRNVYRGWKGEQCLVHRGTDSGYASRFFYTAKASPSERGKGNNHPTVKPIALMSYLCRLVTPPKGIILDPFVGSGTTLRAATIEGFNFIGIELKPEHVEIAQGRCKVTPMMF